MVFLARWSLVWGGLKTGYTVDSLKCIETLPYVITNAAT